MFLLEVNKIYDNDSFFGKQIQGYEIIEDNNIDSFLDEYFTDFDSCMYEYEPLDTNFNYKINHTLEIGNSKKSGWEKIEIDKENKQIELNFNLFLENLELTYYSDCIISFKGEEFKAGIVSENFKKELLKDILKNIENIKNIKDLINLYKNRYELELGKDKESNNEAINLVISVGNSKYGLININDNLNDIIKSVFLDKNITNYNYEFIGNIDNTENDINAFDSFEDMMSTQYMYQFPNYEIKSRVNSEDAKNVITNYTLEKNDLFLADRSCKFNMKITDYAIENSRNYKIDISFEKLDGITDYISFNLSDSIGYKLLEYISTNIGNYISDPEKIDYIIPGINNYIEELQDIERR